MKNKKRYLFGMLALLSFTGCSATDENITKMTENMNSLEDASGDMTADIDIHMAVDEVSMDVSMGIDGMWEIVKEPLAFHFDGNIHAQLLGVEEEVEFYVVQEEDTVKTYVNYENEWTSESIDTNAFADETEREELAELWEIFEGSISVEEAEDLWHYEMEVTADELLSMMSLLEEVTLEELSGWIGTDVSDFSGKIIFEIEKEEAILESCILDFTEGFHTLIQGTVGMMGVDEASISKAILELNLKDYDEGISIEVPQAALTSEEIAEEQAAEVSTATEMEPAS